MQAKNLRKSKNFGEHLKSLRLASGFVRPEEFADKMGISRATVYNWERSNKPPHPKYHQILSKTLGLDLSKLLDYKSEVTNKVSSAERAHEYMALLGRESPTEEDCLAYLESFIRRAVNHDPSRINWLWVELHEKFPFTKWRELDAADSNTEIKKT